MSGCLEHLHNSESPERSGETMIPTDADLLKVLYPEKCTRDFLPPGTWWSQTVANVDCCIAEQVLICTTRKNGVEHLAAAVKA